MNRIDYYQEKPEMISKLRVISSEQKDFELDGNLRSILELRVSQINGCAYCTDLHSREARNSGETTQRLDTLPVWRESPFFDEREKAALQWAEALTLIPDTNANDACYEQLHKHFSSREVVELSISISLANFWNRMASGFRRIPQSSCD